MPPKSAFSASKLYPSSSTEQPKYQRREPKAVHIERDIDIDDNIDGNYIDTPIPGITGKWKNVALSSKNQLSGDADLLRSLVGIQVLEEGDFKAIRETEQQFVPKKKLTLQASKIENRVESVPSLNKYDISDSDDDNNKMVGTKPLTKKQLKQQQKFEKLQRQHEQKQLLQQQQQQKQQPQKATTLNAKALLAAKKSKQQPLQQQQQPTPDLDDGDDDQQVFVQPLTTTKSKQQPTKSVTTPTPTTKSTQQKSNNNIIKENVIVVDAEPNSFQWFDDLSDDEVTKKEKKVQKRELLSKKLEKAVLREKMNLYSSLNDDFEAMNDIDEDDEYEFEAIDDEDDEVVIEDDEKKLDTSNPLANLIQFDGSDGDDDDDDRFITPISLSTTKDEKSTKSSAKSTPKVMSKISPYHTKIAPHMFSLEKYLTTTMRDIEEDEQDDELSTTQYYSSPNGPLYHFHQDYQSWLPYDLHPFLQLAIIREKFTAPRPIQAESMLPALRDHKDIVGIAQTGSGKTLAFLFPILQHIIQQREERNEIETIWKLRQTALYEHEMHGKHFKDHLSAIIITPTRELAMQINDQIKIFGSLALIKPTLIVGGIFLEKQLRLVSQNTPIIIGTPGRIWDVLKHFNSPIDLTFLRFLVLDEADRMVAAGAFDELNNIIDFIKMALTRRDMDQEKVKTLLLAKQEKLQQQVILEQSLDMNDKGPNDKKRKGMIGPEMTTTTNTNKNGKNNNNNNEELTSTTKKSKTNPSSTTQNNNKNRKNVPQRKKIDFGPMFADADTFDLDAYLDNIEKQRRGEITTPTTTKGKNDTKSKSTKPTKQQQSKPSQQMSNESEDDDNNNNDDSDEDEDAENEFINQVDFDEDDEGYGNYIDSDVDVDQLLDEDEDNEDGEQEQQQQYDDNEHVQLLDTLNTTNQREMDKALIEKYTTLTNKIPRKLQVFLFSATLTLQDNAREQEFKRNKIGARELSQKQGKIAPKSKSALNVIDSKDEIAEQQRIESLQKLREEGKSRLIELSKRLTLESPCIIDLTSVLILPPTLQQYCVELSDTTSRDASLYGLLYGQEDITAIVFVNSIIMTRKIADFLNYLNINAEALHSDSDQKGRIKVIEQFKKRCATIQKEKQLKLQRDAEMGFEDRELQARGLTTNHFNPHQLNKNNKNGTNNKNQPMKKYGSVLVCTDIVARGLDIPNLDVVIHYHVPFDGETYIHRCGRTARGTNFGKSVILVSPQEDQLWRIIQHQLHLGVGKDQDVVNAANQELNNTIKNNKQDNNTTTNNNRVTPSNVAEVKRISFNSKYLVYIRERLRLAHQLAEATIVDKVQKKEQEYESKLRDAFGFEDDDDWMLTKKEKNRIKNEEEGIISHENNKHKRELQKARYDLNFLLNTRIFTQGGSFDW